MGVEVVNAADLEAFRIRLLEDITKLLASQSPKKWLKTQEVMDMLGMSEVTLLTLRNKGIIPFRKLGNICYYHVDELDEAIKKLQHAKP